MKIPLRRASVAVAVLALSAISIASLRRAPRESGEVSRIVRPVRRAAFTRSITTTGELRARKFVTIMGPSSQAAEIFQTKISWMVPEGTAVKQGDRVAELDATPAATRLQSVRLDVQRAEAEYTNAELDSAMTLSQAREDLRTAEYVLEERSLGKQQAVYEAPTVKRQAEIDYDRALRAFEAAKRTLEVKTQQAIAKISIAATNVERRRNAVKAVEDAIGEFTVYAPQDGLVIYLREYGGRKKGIGSTFYPWDPAVATLPDLTAMQSQTYVNEVDIRSVAVDQPVRITLDAEPGKRLNGRVISVANVGEQRPGQDAKVFEVVIDIVEADTTLRPSMTTANAIEVATTTDVLTIPVAAVVTERGNSFVYVRDGSEIVKQAVELGGADNVNVVVASGLSENDEVVTRLLPTEVVTRTRPLPSATAAAASTAKP